MATFGTSNVQDNGNVTTLMNQFVTAISLLVSQTLPTNIVFDGTDTGTTNAAVVTSTSPPISSAEAFNLFLIKKSAAANTGPMKLQIGGTTATLEWADGSALIANDWPASVPAFIMFDGTVFRLLSVMGPSIFARASNVRPVLTASQTYFVNASTGSDTSNGLTSATAFATIQKAANVIGTFDLNNNTVTVNVANGSYGPVVLPQISGGGVNFVGNPSSPSSVTISGTTSSALRMGQGGTASFNGFTFSAAGLEQAVMQVGALMSLIPAIFCWRTWDSDFVSVAG
jgi:hypothetical protein